MNPNEKRELLLLTQRVIKGENKLMQLTNKVKHLERLSDITALERANMWDSIKSNTSAVKTNKQATPKVKKKKSWLEWLNGNLIGSDED